MEAFKFSVAVHLSKINLFIWQKPAHSSNFFQFTGNAINAD